MDHVWLWHRLAVVLLSSNSHSDNGMLLFQLRPEVQQVYLEWQQGCPDLECTFVSIHLYAAHIAIARMHRKPLSTLSSVPEAFVAVCMDLHHGMWPITVLIMVQNSAPQINLRYSLLQLPLALMIGHVCPHLSAATACFLSAEFRGQLWHYFLQQKVCAALLLSLC